MKTLLIFVSIILITNSNFEKVNHTEKPLKIDDKSNIIGLPEEFSPLRKVSRLCGNKYLRSPKCILISHILIIENS